LFKMNDGTVARKLRGTAVFSLNDKGWRLFDLGSSVVDRLIKGRAALDMGPLGERLFKMNSETLNRTINGIVDLSGLNAKQSSLLDVISGSSNGTVTLGGGFVFDPSKSFETWFGASTEANISAPMADLRLSLLELANTMRSDMTQRAQDAALQGRVNAAGTVASALARDANGNVLTNQNNFDRVARAAGVSTSLSESAKAAQIAGLSGSDGITGFNVVSDIKGYLFDQLRAKDVAVNASEYLRIYSDLQGDRLYDGDPAGHFDDYGRAEILAGTRLFVPSAFDWSSIGINIPGFATGVTNFAGGLAQINERGGEIVTLPSGADVIPHDLSKRMVDRATRAGASENTAMLAELRALRKDLSDLKRQSGTFDAEKVRFARKNNTLLERQQAREEGVL
jgi:hypothetical protein